MAFDYAHLGWTDLPEAEAAAEAARAVGHTSVNATDEAMSDHALWFVWDETGEFRLAPAPALALITHDDHAEADEAGLSRVPGYIWLSN